MPESKPAQALLDFIDASPSPWHAVATAVEQLKAQGYRQLQESDAWQLESGGKYFVTRANASLVAFTLGRQSPVESGFRIVGAHTDSPGLRLKPKAAHSTDGLLRLGVEVYGGPILATFADRDLSLAGRVHVEGTTGHTSCLLRFEAPLVRLPNLAIHMNREVNESGLKFNKQTELPLILGLAKDAGEAHQEFLALIGKALQVAAEGILAYEFAAYDTQKGVFWGADHEFIADSQLDNLASCHAALTALLATAKPDATCVCALFDHEEVGSVSLTGAAGSFLSDLLERIEPGVEERKRAFSRSFFISADMAHAYHPNFPNAYDAQHKVMVNGGPVIKHNANQRYTTSGETAARFIALCNEAKVPYQEYVHRTDLGCGSTIGPILAASLGIACVDVGSPMWSMHSIRESAGALDQGYMVSALQAHFNS
ncbi:MAG TPA: M18 family aminopeptidase [Methylophilaceae bacterium]|nr:M18 family aminopeptidase [Methylophilaceae bacterium]